MIMMISFVLVCLFAGFISLAFNSYLYFFISAFANIVLNIEILSLFRAISPCGIIFINIICLAFAIYLWLKKGKPLPQINKNIIKVELNKLLNSFKLDKTLIILGIGVLFTILISFILAAFLPVNDFDALSYHTYRALVWAEKGYIFHFDTNDIRNLVMPINSELIYTWIYTLTKKDTGFGLLNFFTYLFGIAGIWALLKRLKFSFRKSLWSIFIFTSFAGIISQISSTQSDLIIGVLILYSIIFFYDFINLKNTKKLFFSSLAMALALGTKSTAFIICLPVIILFFIYIFKKNSKPIENFSKFFAFLSLNFLIFSSYNYILNFLDYSNPFGSEISVNRHGFFGGFKAFIANFITYNLQLFDFAGFKWGIYLTPFVFKIKKALFNLFGAQDNTGVLMPLESLNSSLSEQSIGFGITGFLVFLPSIFYSIFMLSRMIIKKEKVKENRIILYTLGMLFYLCIIVLSFTLGYMMYSIRFIAAFVTISSPILVLTYFKKNNFYKTIVTLFCLFYFFIASTHLAARPFFDLLNSYKLEKSYENFIYNTRCMNYNYFKGDRDGCQIDENIFQYIENYKTVGIFADENMLLHLTKVNASKKHILTDELVVSRIDKYNLSKYDYIITPYPKQAFDEFNNKDKKLKEEGKFLNNCYFQTNNNNKKVVKIECAVPYKKLEKQGFIPIYNIRIKLNNIDNKEFYTQYIIWKNEKLYKI